MGKIITIATGTELMQGRTLDRNFHFIASNLADRGITPTRHEVVGDDICELKQALKKALHDADAVIMTGGLGPTTDDCTREIVSAVLKKKLLENPHVLQDIRRQFNRRHLTMPSCARTQARVVEGARVIQNRVGTAPGMQIRFREKDLFLLPGPPDEMQPMFMRQVLPEIIKKFSSKTKRIINVRTLGIRESDVQERMNALFKQHRQFLNSIGYCASAQGVDVRVEFANSQRAKIMPLLEDLKRDLQPWIYAEGRTELYETVADLLMKKRQTIAVAESCTGGLVSHMLTRVPGISHVFQLGTVTYSNDAKHRILGVHSKIFKRPGSVSARSAMSMAEGVRRVGHSKIGIAVTGIAGPSGGTKYKPVGLVWIALSDGTITLSKKYQFLGGRDTIRKKSAQAVFEMLRRYLLKMDINADEVA